MLSVAPHSGPKIVGYTDCGASIVMSVFSGIVTVEYPFAGGSIRIEVLVSPGAMPGTKGGFQLFAEVQSPLVARPVQSASGQAEALCVRAAAKPKAARHFIVLVVIIIRG